MNEEERAALYELDQSFLTDDDDIIKPSKSSTRCNSCLQSCSHLFLDKGAISLMVTFFILAIGIVLLALSRELELPEQLEEFSIPYDLDLS